MMCKIVFCLFAVVIACCQCLKISQKGRHFILAFPSSGTDDNINLLVITSENDVRVYVSSKHTVYNIAAGSSERIYLPFETTVVSNLQVEKKGIQIIASEPVSVYAYVSQHDSIGGFLVLPVESLSTEYIVVTYLPHNTLGGHIVVVATDDNTVVFITMKSGVSSVCNGKLVPNGHLFTVTLHSLEVFRIFCTQDLTGTLIQATKPVAVLSGNPLAQVPQNVEYPDNLVEMMIPTYAYGRKYALPPDYGRACGTIYRIVALKNRTEVVESNGTRHILSERSFMDLSYDHANYGCLESNNPILVVQFGKGQSADSTYQGDPFMAIVPSLERYASSYDLDLYSPSTTLANAVVHYLTITVNKAQSAGLEFMNFLVFQTAPACELAVGSKNSIQGQVELVHQDGTSFGATVHGLTAYKAYGYLAGIILDDFSGVRECASKPCGERGLCYEVDKTYRCFCPTDIQGVQCQKELIPETSTTTTPYTTTAPTTHTTTVSTVPSTTDHIDTSTTLTSTAASTTDHIDTSTTLTSTSAATTDHIDTTTTLTSTETYETPTVPLTEVTQSTTDTSEATESLSTQSETPASSTGIYVEPLTTTEPTVSKVKDTLEPEVTTKKDPKSVILKSTKLNPCNCTCKNITYEEVEEKAKEMKKELTVNPVVLSKSKRKFVSVQDNRLSASSIGYLGGAFLTLVFGSIFLVDLSTVMSRWLASVRDKTKAHENSLRETSVHRRHVLHVRPDSIVLRMSANHH